MHQLRHLLATILLLPVLGSLASCEEFRRQEREQEERKRIERIREIVSSQLRIPPGRVSYGTKELSEVARESLANKLLSNRYMLYAGFTVVNDSSYDVKDFQVHFSVTAPSGTKMSSVTSDTIYEIIPANESRYFGPMEIAAIKISNPAVVAAIKNFELVSGQIE